MEVENFEDSFLNNETKLSSKSSIRFQYEAQVKTIRSKMGDIENIRINLGLSKRKMAQLLFVDPSAWTRWVKSGNTPPHIYRALEWYLLLQEKYPGMGNSFWLSAISSKSASIGLGDELLVLRKSFSTEISRLEEEIRRERNLRKYLISGIFLNLLVIVSVFFWKYL